MHQALLLARSVQVFADSTWSSLSIDLPTVETSPSPFASCAAGDNEMIRDVTTTSAGSTGRSSWIPSALCRSASSSALSAALLLPHKSARPITSGINSGLLFKRTPICCAAALRNTADLNRAQHDTDNATPTGRNRQLLEQPILRSMKTLVTYNARSVCSRGTPA